MGCEFFTQDLPSTFTSGGASVRYVRDNIAVIPDHWTRSGGVGKSIDDLIYLGRGVVMPVAEDSLALLC